MAARRAIVKPISFRVYPDGKFLYAEVNIWPTKKAMQDHMQSGRGYTAICTTMERINRQGRKLGQFCEINFYRGALGVGVVSHEMGHAAFSWAARRGIPIREVYETNAKEHSEIWQHQRHNKIAPDGNPEERIVYVLGELCRRFTQKCYDLGLYYATLGSK